MPETARKAAAARPPAWAHAAGNAHAADAHTSARQRARGCARSGAGGAGGGPVAAAPVVVNGGRRLPPVARETAREPPPSPRKHTTAARRRAPRWRLVRARPADDRVDGGAWARVPRFRFAASFDVVLGIGSRVDGVYKPGIQHRRPPLTLGCIAQEESTTCFNNVLVLYSKYCSCCLNRFVIAIPHPTSSAPVTMTVIVHELRFEVRHSTNFVGTTVASNKYCLLLDKNVPCYLKNW